MRFSSRPAAVAFFAALLCGAATAPAATTGDQSGDLAAFVHGGLAAAPNNFSAVRGKRMDTSRFAALVDFGPTFQSCTVNDDTSDALENGGISGWSLQCESLPLDAAADDLTAQLKDQLAASVPATFVFGATRDASGLPHLHWIGPEGVAIDAVVWRTGDNRSHFRVSAVHVVGGGLPPQAPPDPSA